MAGTGTVTPAESHAPARRAHKLGPTKSRVLVGATLLGFGIAVANVAAFRHARAFGEYASSGVRTQPPEKLTPAGRLAILINGVTVPRPENQRTPQSDGLEYETQRFPGARGETIEAWSIPCPDTRGVVVLFHGYGGSKDSLIEPAIKFREMGWSTVLIDFHGNGGSSGKHVSAGWHEADDVASALGETRKTVKQKPVVLYGSSMGAVAILRAIHVRGARPDGVILECPFDRLVTTVGHRFSAMNLPPIPLSQLLVYWGGFQQDFDGFTHNPTEYAKSVTCPAMVMHGDQDPRVSMQEARSVFANLVGPKRFTSLSGVGHQSYLTARPEEWRRGVAEFLGAISP